jgi:hypothetical protein
MDLEASPSIVGRDWPTDVCPIERTTAAMIRLWDMFVLATKSVRRAGDWHGALQRRLHQSDGGHARMAVRSVPGVGLLGVALLLLSVFPANAECIKLVPKQILDPPDTELVFSGTVLKIVSSGEMGLRTTFEVDQVWKGEVPKQFDLYTWFLDSANMPTYESGHSYVVAAKRLTDRRARDGVGLGNSDAAAFKAVPCSGLFSTKEFVGAMGPGKAPSDK